MTTDAMAMLFTNVATTRDITEAVCELTFEGMQFNVGCVCIVENQCVVAIARVEAVERVVGHLARHGLTSKTNATHAVSAIELLRNRLGGRGGTRGGGGALKSVHPPDGKGVRFVAVDPSAGDDDAPVGPPECGGGTGAKYLKSSEIYDPATRRTAPATVLGMS